MKPDPKRVAAAWPGKETPDLEIMGDVLDEVRMDALETVEIEALLDYVKRARTASGRRRIALLDLMAGHAIRLLAWMEANEPDPALKTYLQQRNRALQLLARNPQPEKFTVGE